jgi:hypothetical protein
MSGMLFNLLDFVLDGLCNLEISWPVRPAWPSRPGPSANSPNRPRKSIDAAGQDIILDTSVQITYPNKLWQGQKNLIVTWLSNRRC